MVLAVVAVVHMVLAIGFYEHRITVVTHGAPELAAFAYAYELFDYLMGPLGYAAAVTALRALAWLLAAAAVLLWVQQVRVRPDRVTFGWVSAAAVLKVLAVVLGDLPASRVVAYPLWVLSTVALVVALWRLTSDARGLIPSRGAA
jgi:hypothetical protein